jgi:hypothetical protein
MRQQGYRFSLDTLPDAGELSHHATVPLTAVLAGPHDPPPSRY